MLQAIADTVCYHAGESSDVTSEDCDVITESGDVTGVPDGSAYERSKAGGSAEERGVDRLVVAGQHLPEILHE